MTGNSFQKIKLECGSLSVKNEESLGFWKNSWKKTWKRTPKRVKYVSWWDYMQASYTEDEESLAAGKNIVSNEPISQKYKYFGCGVVFITCFAALFGYYNKTKRNEDMIGLLENFNEEV